MDSKTTTRTPRIVERATGVPGLRLLRGRNVTFAEPRSIVHADYAIKLTTAGSGAPLWYRGAYHRPCTPGELNVFSPFEPLLATKSEAATDFTTLLIEPQLVAAALAAPDSGPLPLHTPHLPQLRQQVAVPGLLALATALDNLDSAASGAELELQFAELLEQLLAAPTSGAPSPVPVAVGRARELILDNLAENFSMVRLERECGLGRFQLIRAFRRQYGLPPREFRIRARLALARRLLAHGRSQADVAHAVGFYDQSHFHRHFRRLLGIGPGHFQRALGLRNR